MRKGGGKAKGAQFERDACVMLSKWMTKNERTDVFWRSAMSGGRATVARKTRGEKLSSQVGDISCVHPAGASFISSFAVECKFYADLNFNGLLTGKGKLLEFWNKLKQEADTHKKHPFLVCRQNRLPTYIGLDRLAADLLKVNEDRFAIISPKYDLRLIDAAKFIAKVEPFAWRLK
jgi:hypothetical protein